jgi:hypothetical protein
VVAYSSNSPFQKGAYTNESLVIHYPQTPYQKQVINYKKEKEFIWALIPQLPLWGKITDGIKLFNK